MEFSNNGYDQAIARLCDQTINKEEREAIIQEIKRIKTMDVTKLNKLMNEIVLNGNSSRYHKYHDQILKQI